MWPKTIPLHSVQPSQAKKLDSDILNTSSFCAPGQGDEFIPFFSLSNSLFLTSSQKGQQPVVRIKIACLRGITGPHLQSGWLLLLGIAGK